MKPSRYNHFFPYSETQSVAYNAFTNSLALIDQPNLQAYKEFCNNDVPLPEELSAALKKGAFLVDDFIDELDLLRFRMLQGRYTTDHLGLTIAPTSDCNFRCVYCYEKDVLSNQYMSQEVEDKILDMLNKRKKLISSFFVTWYGGEPLMAFDTVERLSKKFIEICEENEISYSSHMITNGYLLTRDILERIAHLKIKNLQITIDGLPEIHNKNRPLVGGGDTFDTIMNNLKNGYDLLPQVSLRINIDKDNMSAGEDVYKFLDENNMLEKVIPYHGKTSNITKTYEASKCLNHCDFSEHSYDFDLATTARHGGAVVQYPNLKSSFCGADTLYSYTIDAEGGLYKCWSDIGVKERQVGHLVEEGFGLASDLLYKYMLFDPTVDEHCKDCDVLPICMGSCPYVRLADDTDNCTRHKYILEKCMVNAVGTLKAKIK